MHTGTDFQNEAVAMTDAMWEYLLQRHDMEPFCGGVTDCEEHCENAGNAASPHTA